MFTINGKKASTFKAKMIDRVISSNEVITIDDWLDGAAAPTFIRQQEKFKKISLTVIIEGKDENEVYMMFSKLAAELRFGTLAFDDMDLTFKVVLEGSATPERLKKGVYQVEYSLKSAYGMGKEKVEKRQGGDASRFTINNPGTAETPCIIEITPSQRIGQITFQGLADKAFQISDLERGQKIIIDGEQCLITIDGEINFKTFDGWGFPTLIPGSNEILVSSALGYSMDIKYKPRYN